MILLKGKQTITVVTWNSGSVIMLINDRKRYFHRKDAQFQKIFRRLINRGFVKGED